MRSLLDAHIFFIVHARLSVIVKAFSCSYFVYMNLTLHLIIFTTSNSLCHLYFILHLAALTRNLEVSKHSISSRHSDLSSRLNLEILEYEIIYDRSVARCARAQGPQLDGESKLVRPGSTVVGKG